MGRTISERTRTIRRIIEEIQPEKLDGISLSNLEPELREQGISIKTEKEKYTVYSELTRRRRMLGRLKAPAASDGATSYNAGESSLSPEFYRDVPKLVRAIRNIEAVIATQEEPDIILAQLVSWIGKLGKEDMLAIRRFTEKHGGALLIAVMVGLIRRAEEKGS